MRARAFPGIISAWKVSPGELLAYVNPRLAAEEGAKANPGGAAERRRNAGLGAALDAQCVTGTTADGFTQVKECAKANPGGAAESCKNAGPGAVLEAQCATGTAADGFAQVKERAAEPATVAEGDALAGASTAERMHMLPGAWRCPGSCC